MSCRPTGHGRHNLQPRYIEGDKRAKDKEKREGGKNDKTYVSFNRN